MPVLRVDDVGVEPEVGPAGEERIAEEEEALEVIVEAVFSSIVGALQKGDKIELRGFGSFRIRRRDSRTGRNPKTGVGVVVPAKKVPHFKPGKELRELINRG